MTIRLNWGIWRVPLAIITAVAALWAGAVSGAPVLVEHADAATVSATYRATDNLSIRRSPTAAPGAPGGPRRGEAFGVECQIEGEPVGPRGNRLYFRINYRAVGTMYVPDTWTDSPHLAGQPPLKGIPLCTGSASKAPSSTYLNTTTPVRMCTNLADASCRPVWNLPAQTTVSMRCWIDESSYAGTPRWFWVTGGGVAGFVSANHVSRQTRVGWCGNDLQVKAIRWAGSHLDEDFEAGWCQRFVRRAYQAAGRDIGSASTAANYWRANPRRYGRTGTAAPPAGNLAYWNGTARYPDGHVALSIGNGWAISTEERGTRQVHVMSIADRNKTKPYYGALNVT